MDWNLNLQMQIDKVQYNKHLNVHLNFYVVFPLV